MVALRSHELVDNVTPFRPRSRQSRDKLRLVDTDSGELFDVQVAQKRGWNLTSMWGPHWLGVPGRTFTVLASDRDLKPAELRVLLFLLGRVERGNHIRMRPIDVANEMEQDRHHVAAALRKLCERGILVPWRPFGWKLHPAYGFRGDPKGIVTRKRTGELVLVPD